MRWIKKKKLFDLEKTSQLIYSHASNPVPVHLKDDIFRVFFSSRNALNQSSVSYVDVDIIKEQVVEFEGKIIHQFGPKGSFFADGISVGDVYSIKNQSYMLFMGWQSEGLNHWRGDIGRFKLINNSELELNPIRPFMGIEPPNDLISLSYPFVLYDDGIYKMWYGSTLDWTSENGEMIHSINYATSIDGEKWDRKGIAIDYQIGVAQAFSKPTIIKKNGIYHMWYSFRSGDGTPYRIGYSNSEDGIKWNNFFNESGISVSETGWDSQMVCYPYVFSHKNEIYMLYNGNEYGKTGFGLAKLK
jgi:hypothetical protein